MYLKLILQHVCEECTRTFRHEKDLIKHQEDHSAGKLVYKCNVSSLHAVLHFILYDAHVYTVVNFSAPHTPYKKRLTFQLCGKAYANQKVHWQHRQSHEKVACTVCGMCTLDLPGLS